MQTTLEMVNQLSDSQVIGATKVLFSRVYTEIPYEEVLTNAQGQGPLIPLLSIGENALRKDLTTEDSTRIGRLVLSQYAVDDAFGPLVREAIEKVQTSDDLVVDIILAVGLVVNLTLLMATTKVDISKGPDGKINWRIIKSEASPELVEAVVKPVADMAAKVGK